jgi:hypothetical protein
MDVTEARRVWLSVILGYGTSVFFITTFLFQDSFKFINISDPAEIRPQVQVVVKTPPARQKTAKATTSGKFHHGLPRFTYDTYGEIVYESDSD